MIFFSSPRWKHRPPTGKPRYSNPKLAYNWSSIDWFVCKSELSVWMINFALAYSVDGYHERHGNAQRAVNIRDNYEGSWEAFRSQSPANESSVSVQDRLCSGF